MDKQIIPDWLRWSRRLQAISQTGIHFSDNSFDTIRYEEVGEIAQEILTRYGDLPAEKVRQALSDQPGYATPKVAVRGAVFNGEGEILLVREKMDGLWALPGGWADVNQSPSKMVEREVWEESGFLVSASRLIGIYESNHDRAPLAIWHNYKLLFLCTLKGGQARKSNETDAVDFFSMADLPPLSHFRTHLREIEEAFAHLQFVNRPAYFD